jgi:hypothetical protein
VANASTEIRLNNARPAESISQHALSVRTRRASPRDTRTGTIFPWLATGAGGGYNRAAIDILNLIPIPAQF